MSRGTLDGALKRYKWHPVAVTQRAMLAFAEQIVVTMDQQKLSRKKLAELAGLDPAQITRVLDTQHNVTVQTLGKIAAAMQMELAIGLACEIEKSDGSISVTQPPGPPQAAELHTAWAVTAATGKEGQYAVPTAA